VDRLDSIPDWKDKTTETQLAARMPIHSGKCIDQAERNKAKNYWSSCRKAMHSLPTTTPMRRNDTSIKSARIGNYCWSPKKIQARIEVSERIYRCFQNFFWTFWNPIYYLYQKSDGLPSFLSMHRPWRMGSEGKDFEGGIYPRKINSADHTWEHFRENILIHG